MPISRTPRLASTGTLLAIAAALLSACAAEDNTALEARIVPMPPTLIGVYSGEFPCDNCAAIEATLWLRDDGRFILRQRYVEDSGEIAATSSYALGRFTWDEVEAAVVLHGAGPRRLLDWIERDQLKLRVASTIPHMLARDPSSPSLAEGLPITGVAVVTATKATFRDCGTGLELDVAPEGAFTDLRRKHRAFNAGGRAALTAVTGYPQRTASEDGASEVWILQSVISVNPSKGC